MDRFWKGDNVGRQQVIGDNRLASPKKEAGKLSEDLALVRDPGPEHVVERRNPVRCDDHEAVAKVVDVSDLPLPIRRTVIERALEDGRGDRQHSPRAGKGATSYRSRWLGDNNNM